MVATRIVWTGAAEMSPQFNIEAGETPMFISAPSSMLTS